MKTTQSIRGSKVNYVVCSWSGQRTHPCPEWKVDNSYYLRQHYNFLKNLKHSLTTITVVDQHNPHPSPQYSAFLSEISEEFSILSNPNIGLSYGAWWAAYLNSMDEFDYYIFIEDDYVPILDNFDSILVDIIEELDAGYVCSWAQPWIDNLQHACISNGIVKSSALKQIYESGVRVCGTGSTRDVTPNGEIGQIVFSRAFTSNDIEIKDYLDYYSAYYHAYGNNVPGMGIEEPLNQLISPVHMLRDIL